MWIGIATYPDRQFIERAFAYRAPWARIWFGDLGTCPDSYNMVLSIRENPSEFPYLIDAWLLERHDDPEKHDEYQLGLAVARELSVMLGCRTICDGSLHGESTSPFWSIIWERGKAYLADDSQTVFADQRGDITVKQKEQLGPVKVVRSLEIKI